MRYDYIVIGSGASGVTTSLILAKNGKKVALVEKANTTSPLLRGFFRRGFLFNTGLHYTGGLGKGKILDLFFRYLGLSGKLKKEPFDPECFDHFRFLDEGVEIAFPTGYDRIRNNLFETFPDESEAINKYLDAIKEICSSRPYMNFDVEIDQWQLLKSINDITLEEYLDELTDNSLLKRLFSMHCLLYGVPPSEAPLSNHACIVGPYYESVHYIKEGGLSLAKAFDVELKKWGVDILCGYGVEEILFSSSSAVKGVRLENKEVLDCKGCVCTTHPRYLLELVPNHLFRSSFVRRIKKLEETLSGYILFGEYHGIGKEYVHPNVYLSSDSKDPLLSLDKSLEKRVTYISFFENQDQGSSKNGFIAICPANIDEVSKWSDSYTGKRPDDYYVFKEEVAQRLIRHIEVSCPELEGKLDVINLSTPLTLRDFTNSPFGSLYGVKHRVGQLNPMPLTKLEGLYLAGQASVAPGVLGAVISGFVVCGNILGHDKIRKGLINCS